MGTRTALLALASMIAFGAPLAPAHAAPTQTVENDSEELTPDYDPMRDSPAAVSARMWRRAGIGLMIVGGVLAGGAAMLAALDGCEPRPGDDCRLAQRRAAALGVGIPAGVIFLGGVTALSIGQSRLNRLALDLRADRTGFALGILARF